MENKNDTIAEILNIENKEIEINPYTYEDKDLNFVRRFYKENGQWWRSLS